MKTITSILFFSFFIVQLYAQQKTAVYTASKADIVNPERGFYIPTGTKASHFVFLDAGTLKNYRISPQQMRSASYKVKVSLIYRGYELDTFRKRPLSKAFLENLQRDFDVVREAGLKVILRFMYTNTARSGNCGDQYGICPPYGDAPREIVLNHIRQLAPLFEKNADVIAVLQQGFIGIWGENYFTDYFGDASTNGDGKILDSSWLSRAEVLSALLKALPVTRMVQVRTPQIKQKFIAGPSASLTTAPIDANAAFGKSDAARIGFHNDCFLASEDDYGTFYDYGSSSQARQPATQVLRDYIAADTRYTVVGGETCDDAFSPNNDCAPLGYAEEEMRRMHYSYLNASYNTQVNNDWDSLGCLDRIKQHLGYRFLLHKTTAPVSVKKDEQFTLGIEMENAGYAAMYNPRPLILVLRNTQSKEEFSVPLRSNPQYWFSGSHTIQEEISLPASIVPGKYQLYLFLPDGSYSLARRPAYAVQLCNESIWEEESGYNKIFHELQIK